MGLIFREPGNIIHKIEAALIESLPLEAHRGMPAKDSLKTLHQFSSKRDKFYETSAPIKRYFVLLEELVA